MSIEKGVETHRISRVSTVTWTEKNGKECHYSGSAFRVITNGKTDAPAHSAHLRRCYT